MPVDKPTCAICSSDKVITYIEHTPYCYACLEGGRTVQDDEVDFIEELPIVVLTEDDEWLGY